MNDLKNKICLKLKSYGFNVVGITKPQVSKETINNYNLFLKKKYHGDMYWLDNHENAKKDPSKIWKVNTNIYKKQKFREQIQCLFNSGQRRTPNEIARIKPGNSGLRVQRRTHSSESSPLRPDEQSRGD